MLQVSGVSKRYGASQVLSHVSFIVNPGERVGLIGPNGCGKTTLLKIIAGDEYADEGSVALSPPHATLGYLQQGLEYSVGDTIESAMISAVPGLPDIQARLRHLELAMSDAGPTMLDGLVAEYGRAQADLERLGGYEIAHRMRAILDGLGLGQDVSTQVEHLSGGQKTRLGLARLLLVDPDLLLLDEPTNHLDVAALEWLEGFLGRYDGAAIVVSHDRTFLDNSVSRVLELDPLTHTIVEYVGGYTDYAEAKDRELDEQWRAYRDQQDRIERYERVIGGLSGKAQRIENTTIHYYWRKQALKIARRAVTQRRRLERMLAAEDRIEKPKPTWQIRLEFSEATPSGKEVVQLFDLSMAYGDHLLFRDVNLALGQGERIVLAGPNGSGKTTLLKLIAGQLAPTSGGVRLGANVRLGFYSQEQENLAADSTPLEEIRRCAACSETEARGFLHYFLFSGDQVFSQVADLSFGERARLAMAKLVAQGCNLLLLDEPINHLDIPSRESFERAMADYTGTVLAVVHDRYFVEGFASGLWVIEGESIRRSVDLGTYGRRLEDKAG